MKIDLINSDASRVHAGLIGLVGGRHRSASSVLVVGPVRPMNDADG